MQHYTIQTEWLLLQTHAGKRSANISDVMHLFHTHKLWKPVCQTWGEFNRQTACTANNLKVLDCPTWSHVWILTQYGHRFVTCFRKRDYFIWVIFYSSGFTPCGFTLSLTMFHGGSSPSWLFTRAVQYPVAVDRALIFQRNSTPELSWRHSRQSCLSFRFPFSSVYGF